MYDYVIIGGGPTGIALATMLKQTGSKIALLEKASSLGGCWRVEWTDEGLYSEHAPRVMTTTYKRFRSLLKHYGVEFDYDRVYSDPFGIYKKILSKLSVTDIFKLFSGFVLSRFIDSKDTVEDFMEHLTSSGAEAMYILSVALANVPGKVMMQDIFDECYKYHGSFVQLKDPSWYDIVERKLKETVDIIKSCEAQYISKRGESFVVECSKGRFRSREIVLALPPEPLVNILARSDDIVRDNWGDISTLQEFARDSTYHSIGFQIHFKQNVSFPKQWCEFCELDWNMVVLPVSEYLDRFSKNENVKTVWSGCIIDQEKYSKILKKKVRECTLEEIEKEIIRQLNVRDIPKIFTFTGGLRRSASNLYESKDSGFIRGKEGTLPFKGVLDNIFLVGPVNHKGIVTMESALEEACEFVKYRFKSSDLCSVLDPPVRLTFLRLILIVCVIMIATKLRS